MPDQNHVLRIEKGLDDRLHVPAGLSSRPVEATGNLFDVFGRRVGVMEKLYHASRDERRRFRLIEQHVQGIIDVGASRSAGPQYGAVEQDFGIPVVLRVVRNHRFRDIDPAGKRSAVE